MINSKKVDLLFIDSDKFNIENINKKFEDIGIKNVKYASTQEEAKQILLSFYPTIAIVDYVLDGGKNGIEFAIRELKPKKIPFIFISSIYEESVFKEMLKADPLDFIPKNISKFELEKTLIISLRKSLNESNIMQLSNFILLKSTTDIKRVVTTEIEYISVEGKYLKIFVDNHFFVIRSSLNDFLKRLPPRFYRIHQAHVVNLNYIQSIKPDVMKVQVGKTLLSISRNYKKELLNTYLIG